MKTKTRMIQHLFELNDRYRNEIRELGARLSVAMRNADTQREAAEQEQGNGTDIGEEAGIAADARIAELKAEGAKTNRDLDQALAQVLALREELKTTHEDYAGCKVDVDRMHEEIDGLRKLCQERSENLERVTSERDMAITEKHSKGSFTETRFRELIEERDGLREQLRQQSEHITIVRRARDAAQDLARKAGEERDKEAKNADQLRARIVELNVENTTLTQQRDEAVAKHLALQGVRE